MGTPDFAVPTLDMLVAAGHDVVAAYSQQPRPGGRRGRELIASPVQRRAEVLGIAVRTPASLKRPDVQEQFTSWEADIGVVAAYGLILPSQILETPRLGCLNVHASILPRWRGAAPIQRAIQARDLETGVGIMQMEPGLDTGPIRLETRTFLETKTAGELTEELAQMGAKAMIRVLADLPAHPPVPQSDEGITYAAKVDKAEAHINWSDPAVRIERQIRAMNPAPGAWFTFAGERIKVFQAQICTANGTFPPGLVLDREFTVAAGANAVRPILLQRAGRSIQRASDFLNGFPDPSGTQL